MGLQLAVDIAFCHRLLGVRMVELVASWYAGVACWVCNGLIIRLATRFWFIWMVAALLVVQGFSFARPLEFAQLSYQIWLMFALVLGFHYRNWFRIWLELASLKPIYLNLFCFLRISCWIITWAWIRWKYWIITILKILNLFCLLENISVRKSLFCSSCYYCNNWSKGKSSWENDKYIK